MKKGKIIFRNLNIDGKHQKEWFKIFDLLDKIFTVEEQKRMSLGYYSCFIKHFNFNNLPKGTTKYRFAEFVAGNNKNKIIEVNMKTGQVTYYLPKKPRKNRLGGIEVI